MPQALVPQVLHVLARALREGAAVHQVGAELRDLTMQLGRGGLDAYFAVCGSGDLGERVTLPDGQQLRRLDDPHPRRYVSVFGAFRLERTAYGSREGQALQFVPLDNRLQLPEGAFSYLL